jgi:hypothetical protein
MGEEGQMERSKNQGARGARRIVREESIETDGVIIFYFLE